MLDFLPAILYFAFSLAALLLIVRIRYGGLVLDIPCWTLYLLHLPLAAAVWSLKLWDLSLWVSGIGNTFLIFCAFEAARLCGWWIIPPRERFWQLVSAGGVGATVAGIVAMLVKIPAGQPAAYYLAGACAPSFSIGVLGFAWAYQRLVVNRLMSNSRFAWHAGLLAIYCALGSLSYFVTLADDELWDLWTYSVVTIKVWLFMTWGVKVTIAPTRALPA